MSLSLMVLEYRKLFIKKHQDSKPLTGKNHSQLEINNEGLADQETA